jgi:Raf kinase inhibitor-like YbhB/YbcL family protein
VYLALGRPSRQRPALRRRGAQSLAATVVALCCALPASGCGLFGSDKEIATPSVMGVSGGEFVGNVMPVRFTCGVPHAPSPPLGWTGAPSGTKSIAVVLDDSAAPITPYVYWIVFNVPAATSDLLEGAASGQLPLGARQARNSAGTVGYSPPCPGPAGHSYRLTVYALNTKLNLPDGTSLQSAWRAIAAAAIGRGRIPLSATSLSSASCVLLDTFWFAVITACVRPEFRIRRTAWRRVGNNGMNQCRFRVLATMGAGSRTWPRVPR